MIRAANPHSMPVILAMPYEIETWLTASRDEVRGLLQSMPDGVLRVAANVRCSGNPWLNRFARLAFISQRCTRRGTVGLLQPLEIQMSILTELHNSEISASIATFFDGAWTVKLGDKLNGFKAEASVDSEAAAYEWLERAAIEYYPESRFAQIHKPVSPKEPDQPGAEGIATARADADTYD